MEWVNEVKALLGLKRDLTRVEMQYILTWKQLNIPKEIISVANDLTCLNTGKVGVVYMNKVLLHWHELGIQTPEEAKKIIMESRKMSGQSRVNRSVRTKDPKQILLAKVAEAWQKEPQLRFGQFLVNFFGECGQDVWHTEDDEWMVGLQAYIDGQDPKAAMDAYFDQKWPDKVPEQQEG